MARSENNFGGFFSLAPGFSPVLKTQNDGSRFNGLCDPPMGNHRAEARC